MSERDPIPMCQQPTKRRMKNGVWLNEPGRCDNRGRYLYNGKLMCGKHRNAAALISAELTGTADDCLDREFVDAAEQHLLRRADDAGKRGGE